MNITFFVGNGFDIGIGLKTKYSDFYPYFFENASKDNFIKTWMKNDIEFWADLEEELGKKIAAITTGKEKEKFYIDKAELDILLTQYLEKEQSKISSLNIDAATEIIIGSLKNFYINLAQAEKTSIDETLNVYKAEDFKYQFVSFNYTSSLDNILKSAKQKQKVISTHIHNGTHKNNLLGDVFHVHGKIESEMILGVNDEEQVKNDFLKKDPEFLDTFIKVRMNDSIGQGKTEYVKKIIGESHIIGIFGMSMGETDKMWWKEIISWLNKNGNNKLIIYFRGDEETQRLLERKIPSNIIRLNNKIKNDFLEKDMVSETSKEKLKKQIFISYNSSFFDFSKIKLPTHIVTTEFDLGKIIIPKWEEL